MGVKMTETLPPEDSHGLEHLSALGGLEIDDFSAADVRNVDKRGSAGRPSNVVPSSKKQMAIRPPLPDPGPNTYRIEGSLRIVEPYFYTYHTFCKQRWRGRRLLDIYECEFRDRPLDYYRDAILAGRITINGTRTTPDHVLGDGDLIIHTIHRHEPPVTAVPIGVIHEDNDMVVIDKPSGVPVHPAGRYYFNSVLLIMRAERGPDFNPLPCNRLDRLTSGIMFIAKTSAGAAKLSAQIAGRTVRKEYVARVVGEFPADGEIVCDQPVLSISPRVGLNRVRANGKPARTVFKRLAYYPPQNSAVMASSADFNNEPNPDPDNMDNTGRPWRHKKGYSIVRCLPVTGRTHQIRVHLQYLGHPIENDPIYANQKVWGLDLGAGDADATLHSDEDILTRLDRMGKTDVATAVAYYDDMVDQYHKQSAERLSGDLCPVCETPLYTDPGLHELSLYLHSLRYEAADGSWSYVSALPQWSLPPPGTVGPTHVGGIADLVEASQRHAMPAELKREVE